MNLALDPPRPVLFCLGSINADPQFGLDTALDGQGIVAASRFERLPGGKAGPAGRHGMNPQERTMAKSPGHEKWPQHQIRETPIDGQVTVRLGPLPSRPASPRGDRPAYPSGEGLQ